MLEYLHHGNDTLIVHCGLKPANVVLDEDMVAHVSDFGITKILAISKSMAHTEILDTLGYIAPGFGKKKANVTDEEIFNENLVLREWINASISKNYDVY
ncbi:hypothetical protein RDI58_026447 [Solanum bulbocastanum]|uniref:Protein kinase domain-containing protein n=1 Tax=Solanum bulbocastanum TaxID=147425 RepID=A0AAN8T1D5_SOLBU